MDFSKVDAPFSKWAEDLKLPVQNEYKGEAVRSVNIMDGADQKWQLWLVPVNGDNQCVIHYWNYKNISRHTTVGISELEDMLNEITTNILKETVPKAKLP